MGPIAAVESVIFNYFSFSGRAPRSEYWWFQLFLLLGFGLATYGDFYKLEANPDLSPLSLNILWFWLATIIPIITVTVRRLHDTGRSGFWYLIAFIPFGALVLFIFMLMPSEHDDNIYGRSPYRNTLQNAKMGPSAYGSGTAKHNPFAAYAYLDKIDEVATPEQVAARKAEVSDYYKSRVLGTQQS